MEDSCLNLKDGHTSLRKNSLQKESGYVNTTQSFGGKFQSSLEGCSGVKSYDNEKAQSTLEGCADVDNYGTPVTNQVRDSYCKIVGNKLLSLLNKDIIPCGRNLEEWLSRILQVRNAHLC